MSLDWTGLSDRELVALTVVGRQAAFTEIMRRYEDPIFRLVRACLGNSYEALDLVQETFVSAYQALGRFDADRSMRAWLSAIALNKCRDWARKRTVRRLLSFSVPIDGETESVADDQVAIDDVTAYFRKGGRDPALQSAAKAGREVGLVGLSVTQLIGISPLAGWLITAAFLRGYQHRCLRDWAASCVLKVGTRWSVTPFSVMSLR